ncbi:MAG: helix-turn-helix transcriptional regulator [Bdellovibrionales bacterium]|nr:helix-turn-helix transcriptional regulator [Bdellovibrionales bacterium]
MELSLGESVRRIRLQKNLDRQSLCDQAGISLNALRHLETGSGSTIRTLVLVVHALGRSDWLMALAPQIGINPLHLVRDRPVRVRASRRVRKNGKSKKG